MARSRRRWGKGVRGEVAIVEAVVEDTGEIAEAGIVAGEDGDSLGAACPVGELSIGPTTECKDGGAGDVDLSAGGGFPAVLECFLWVVGMSVGWWGICGNM
jgi:hypothetical protein